MTKSPSKTKKVSKTKFKNIKNQNPTTKKNVSNTQKSPKKGASPSPKPRNNNNKVLNKDSKKATTNSRNSSPTKGTSPSPRRSNNNNRNNNNNNNNKQVKHKVKTSTTTATTASQPPSKESKNKVSHQKFIDKKASNLIKTVDDSDVEITDSEDERGENDMDKNFIFDAVEQSTQHLWDFSSAISLTQSLSSANQSTIDQKINEQLLRKRGRNEITPDDDDDDDDDDDNGDDDDDDSDDDSEFNGDDDDSQSNFDDGEEDDSEYNDNNDNNSFTEENESNDDEEGEDDDEDENEDDGDEDGDIQSGNVKGGDEDDEVMNDDDDDGEEEKGQNGNDDEVKGGGEEEEDILQTIQSKGGVGKPRNDPLSKFEDLTDSTTDDDVVSFDELRLSKPLLKACSKLGYTQPTPIQRRCIPSCLSGMDICGSAQTGSGKTAAFGLPALERLLYRPKKVHAIRVLVLTPTRELAVQSHSMLQNLAQYTDIRCALIVGGLSMKAQETNLRARPDIVVATPGRLIDHLHNTKNVGLDDIEILILDEADRLLDMGFTDEVEEIVRCCPKNRQTLLFSATITKEVMKLARISLKDPQYIAVNLQNTLVKTLSQEFIRIKSSREGDREAMLVAICSRTYQSRTIIFCKSKRATHRLKLLFGLLSLPLAVELHGNLTQSQRLEALEAFRAEKAAYLMCTDLASRGLDILGTDIVINFHLPKTITQYIHRVGRTARAGTSGRAVSFVGDDDRKMLKEIVKNNSSAPMTQRKIPIHVITTFREQIENIESDIKSIINEEREERELRLAERDVVKGENMVEHAKEIYARPKKSWFQSTSDKSKAKSKSQLSFFGDDGDDEGDVNIGGDDDDGGGDDGKPKKRKGKGDKSPSPQSSDVKLTKRQLKHQQRKQEEWEERNRPSRKKRRNQQLEALAKQDPEYSQKNVKKQARVAKKQNRPQKFNSEENDKLAPPSKKQKLKRKDKKDNKKKSKSKSAFGDLLSKTIPKPKRAGTSSSFKSKKRYKRR